MIINNGLIAVLFVVCMGATTALIWTAFDANEEGKLVKSMLLIGLCFVPLLIFKFVAERMFHI